MRYTITGRNINVTPGLKEAVVEKIGKLERYFNQDTEAIITLSVEKERQKIEVTIPVKGTIIRAEQESNDMYVSIDLVEEIIERQLKKYKNKIVDRHQDSDNDFRRIRLWTRNRLPLHSPIFSSTRNTVPQMKWRS